MVRAILGNIIIAINGLVITSLLIYMYDDETSYQLLLQSGLTSSQITKPLRKGTKVLTPGAGR